MPRRPSISRHADRLTQGTPVEALVGRMDAVAEGGPRADTVPTGFPSIDRMLGGGLRKQDLVILAGDVGAGKSSLGLAIAVRSAKQGHAATMLSAEMTEERLLERALAMEGRVPVDQIRGGRLDDAARSAIGAAALKIRDLPLTLRRLAGSSFDELRQALRAVPRQALLVVDSVQALAAGVGSTTADEGAATAIQHLKDLALERDVAVLALAHTPGLLPGREDPRPTLEDLRALGAPKQLADVVLAIFREEMYRPGYGIEGATELIVAKNRNGQTRFVDLYFYGKWLRFEDMLDPDR